jgi:hypothetical protein
MATNRSLVEVAEAVLAAKAAGRETVTVGVTTFDDLQWNGGGGRCQENARKVYEAATGKPMPGKACCAYRTNLKLLALSRQANSGVEEVVRAVEHGGKPEHCKPGDYCYFRGGSNCGTCGGPVGHVGVWLGGGRMFQHTSRAGLAITAQGPTDDQRARFCGAYRLLPLAEEAQPVAQTWRITIVPDPTDIVARGIGTTWTDHVTRTGIPADTPGLIACSLPRGLCKQTKGSPFVGVPDFALVRVYYPKTGKSIVAPVIDEGPAWEAQAGTGKPGSAMIDLTPAAWTALGGKPNANAEVVVRVLKGSEGVVPMARRL